MIGELVIALLESNMGMDEDVSVAQHPNVSTTNIIAHSSD